MEYRFGATADYLAISKGATGSPLMDKCFGEWGLLDVLARCWNLSPEGGR
jgi:hypothetical protein